MSLAFLISASYDKQIRFWDAACGRTVRCFPFQDSQVNALHLIPDTTHLVVAGFGVLRVYDIAATGTTAGGSGGGVGSQAPPLFSSYENSSAMNMTSVGSFPIHLQKDLATLLTSSVEEASVSFFNNTLELSATQPSSVEGALLGLATAVYATSEDGHIRFFNAFTPNVLQPIWDIPTGAAITCSALSPDRKTLLTGSQIGRVSIWHLPTIVAVATRQRENTACAALGQAPLQEISFDADYTAIRSIDMEPLARWAVAATNAGKLHFLRFVQETGGLDTLASTSDANEKKLGGDKEDMTGAAAEEEGEKEADANAKGSETSLSHGAASGHGANCMQLESVYRSALVSSELGNGGLKVSALASSPFTGHNKGSLASARTSSPDRHATEAPDLLKEQDPNPKRASINSLPKKSPMKKYMMEVFHSFQAHYKYILKVVISPNSDLLVTCCADYTVGRFLIPPELQQVDPTEAECAEEEMDKSRGGDDHLSAHVVSTCSAGNSSPEAKSTTQVRRTDMSPVVTSPLQLTASENTSNLRGNTLQEDGVKAVESTQDEKSQKTSKPASEAALPQQVSKLMGKVGIDASDIQDDSSLQFSVLPSQNLEGPTPCQSAGKTQFTALKPLTGHTRWVWDCVFSDCGQFLFTASSDHNLRMWTSLLTDRVQSTCLIGHTKPVVCCILYYEKKQKE